MCSDVARASPESTLEFLVALDPQFGIAWKSDEPESEDLNYHHIMRMFAEHFARSSASYSEEQLRGLGDWLSEAVASGGVLENAVSTCLLEHSRQLKVNRVLAPYLSKAAKERTHA